MVDYNCVKKPRRGVTDTFYFASLLERWNFDSSLIRIIYKNIWKSPENHFHKSNHNIKKNDISKNQRSISKFLKNLSHDSKSVSLNPRKIIIKKKNTHTHLKTDYSFLINPHERDIFRKLSPLARRQILITPLILDRLQFQSSDNGRAKSRHSTPACSTPPYINRAGLSAGRVTRSP